MEELVSTFSERLREARLNHNLSVVALANKLKIDKEKLYKWEKGTKPSDPKEWKVLERFIENGLEPYPENEIEPRSEAVKLESREAHKTYLSGQISFYADNINAATQRIQDYTKYIEGAKERISSGKLKSFENTTDMAEDIGGNVDLIKYEQKIIKHYQKKIRQFQHELRELEIDDGKTSVTLNELGLVKNFYSDPTVESLSGALVSSQEIQNKYLNLWLSSLQENSELSKKVNELKSELGKK